jgi:hypothetical protein
MGLLELPLVDQARQSLNLAQSRYYLGLGSIVEASQAITQSNFHEYGETVPGCR